MPQINFKVPDEEKDHLDEFCKEHDRGYTELFRQFIRSLPVNGKTLEPPSLSAAYYEPCTHQAENRLAG